MSENSEFDRTAAEPEDPAAEGQYVEGDYGTAGAAGDNPLEAEEGEYSSGDYGNAGVSGATAVGVEEGDYPEGDYGAAGTVGVPASAVNEGEYPDGDYGAAGTPVRTAAPPARRPFGRNPRASRTAGTAKRQVRTRRRPSRTAKFAAGGQAAA
ncbi:hypothetical protein [Arthrobacter sp. H16F315]|uniref:hypothetical protein n=1 Tax=Arthrobacter sp. H16F315 TaxID=2955314 RepID=UPI00209681E1|nr:hypothetical protein [Arthrobacter sp. H16F315]MDD1476368.1 hypothetical protein [Arthrobacter sp. H16F315]